MTRISQTKRSVRRATDVTYKRRTLCIELAPRYLRMWEQRRRDALEVSYDAIYEFALKMRWRKEQAEKRGQRK